MMRASGWLEGPVLRSAALGAVCLLLVFVFFLAQFPYARLRVPLAGAASDALGAEVTIGALHGGPTGVRLEQVWVRRAGSPAWEVAWVRLRPAFSLGWLRGIPALALRAEAWGVHLDGTAFLDAQAPGFDGRVRGLDPAALPPGLLADEPPWIGAIDLDADLVRGAAGPEGRLVLSGSEGALSIPGLPFALPYDRVEGRAQLGPEGVQLEAFELEGPMLSGSAQGRLGAGPPAQAPLDVELTLRRAVPEIRDLLRGLGVPLGADGRARLRIGGTLQAPVVTPLGG